jgi:hypothetical protein
VKRFKRRDIDLYSRDLMAKTQQNWGAFILQLVGSIILLAVVFGGGLPALTGLVAGWGAGAFWVPLFLGAAVISAVALFFASFGYVGGMTGPKMAMMGLGTDAIAGLTLVAMTWNPADMTWTWASILGFVLCFLASAMAEK